MQQQRDMRQLFIHRHKLVQCAHPVEDRVAASGLNQGVQKKRQLWNEQGRALLAEPSAAGVDHSSGARTCLHLLGVVEPQIEQLDKAVEHAAEANPQAVLLMSQPGVGPITALAFCCHHRRGISL